MGKKSRVKTQKSGTGATATVSPKEILNLTSELLQSKCPVLHPTPPHQLSLPQVAVPFTPLQGCRAPLRRVWGPVRACKCQPLGMILSRLMGKNRFHCPQHTAEAQGPLANTDRWLQPLDKYPVRFGKRRCIVAISPRQTHHTS